MKNKAVRRYLHQVKRFLPWGHIRAQLTHRANAMLAAYLQETPNANGGDLTTAFGPAPDFARELLSSLDPGLVARAETRQRLLRRSVAAALALALTAVTAVFFFRWQKLRSVLPDGEGFMVIGPVDYLTDEEAEEIFNDPNVTIDENHEVYIEGKHITEEGS